MNPEPKPCTFKGCGADTLHHHYHQDAAKVTLCGLIETGECHSSDIFWGPTFAPRVTKSARIAALEAENAALIEQGWADAQMIASLTAKLAAKEDAPTVSVEPYPGLDGAVTVLINGERVGMVFGDYGYRTNYYHATADSLGLSDYHATQAEAVAAIVAAWQRVQA